ncbi:MAG: NADH-quinone oxidoreductase subunit B, partial [Victivallales bacterium]|nr:NADH-quinone oxidoreductase subunit B [Victivallales bacterium]
CAVSGGIFKGGEDICGPLENFFPVDLFIPGCPPHPATILDGLLRLVGRISESPD